MRLLEERILKDGKVLPGGVLKVGSFLNQQVDSNLLREMAEEIKNIYKDSEINKILTVEASGIAIAAACGIAMKVPMVFAKKHETSNVDGEMYRSKVHSFTHRKDYNLMVSKDYLGEGDNVLLVDDFLANGNALRGLIELTEQAGARVVGAAIAIEKCFQDGGDRLRAQGIRIESLAKIEALTDNRIFFKE